VYPTATDIVGDGKELENGRRKSLGFYSVP
jgi:hypothetical protein